MSPLQEMFYHDHQQFQPPPLILQPPQNPPLPIHYHQLSRYRALPSPDSLPYQTTQLKITPPLLGPYQIGGWRQPLTSPGLPGGLRHPLSCQATDPP